MINFLLILRHRGGAYKSRVFVEDVQAISFVKSGLIQFLRILKSQIFSDLYQVITRSSGNLTKPIIGKKVSWNSEYKMLVWKGIYSECSQIQYNTADNKCTSVKHAVEKHSKFEVVMSNHSLHTSLPCGPSLLSIQMNHSFVTIDQFRSCLPLHNLKNRKICIMKNLDLEKHLIAPSLLFVHYT